MKPAVQNRPCQEFCTKHHQQKEDVRCCPGVGVSPSSLAYNSSHLEWPQLFLWSYVWWHNIPTATTVINASFLVKNKTAREKSGCCLEWLHTRSKAWLHFLHPVFYSILSKFAFKYWDISIQEEGKIFPYSKFKNSEGKTVSGISSAWVLLFQLSRYKKTGTVSLMKRVCLPDASLPHSPSIYLCSAFRIATQKRKA